MIDLVIGILSTAAALAVPVPGGKETPAFRCRTGRTLTMVVRDGDTLAYRSLRGGRVEIQLTGGVVARRGYSGGGELQAWFVNGPWTYVVYERVVRTSFSGNNDPRFESGVDVLRGGMVVHRRPCDDQDDQFSDRVLELLGEGRFVEH